jgi:hypothetical protein
MKEIPLTQGYVALVDDEDYDDLIKTSWCCTKQSGRGVYACRGYRRGGPQVHVLMHRQIMGFPPRRIQVDHIDHNTLNNQKMNLRLCTNRQNHYNLKIRSTNTSGYMGVHPYKNRWVAQITAGDKKKYLGRFVNVEDAARAYDSAAVKFYGEFARLNFP